MYNAHLRAICEEGGHGAAQDAEQQEQRQLVQRPQLVLRHAKRWRGAQSRLQRQFEQSMIVFEREPGCEAPRLQTPIPADQNSQSKASAGDGLTSVSPA